MNVAAGRPYPPTGITTAEWRRLPAETVRIADLTTTQTHLHLRAMLLPQLRPGSDTIPHVVEHGGRLYLEDGHHRVTLAAIRGEDTITVRVWRG